MADNPLVPFQMPVVKGDGEERMNPAVLSFIMQASMAAQMAKMRMLEESKVPTGSKSFKLTVTDSITELSVGLVEPWISFSLVNDGPSGVYVEVNEPGKLLDKVPVNSGETETVDMRYPIINIVYLQAESGGTAAVRIKAKTGKGG